ncbi:MAG: hypothetical protein ABIP75_13750 [Pyrinomonadaceae bacterium]
MSEQHIIERLESGPLAQFNESELAQVAAHVSGCESCRQAYLVAQTAEELLRTRAADLVQPPPFFQTRVLAAWRERQAANEVWSFGRLWRTAGAVFSSMAATVAVLAALTFALPATSNTTNSPALAQSSAYSAEDVIFSPDESDSTVSDEQVVTTIMDADDELR